MDGHVDAIEPVLGFLHSRTPQAWVAEAVLRTPELLLDHANCELKAASTALGIIYRYPEKHALVDRMSRLAREELRHFEQVRKIMQELDLPFVRLTASRYAGELRARVRIGEPRRLVDLLIIGALIEARSCERFATIAPHLPELLARFYRGLLASEARHFEHYLAFAKSESGIGGDEFENRLDELRHFESALITAPDSQFRFHSGTPAQVS